MGLSRRKINTEKVVNRFQIYREAVGFIVVNGKRPLIELPEMSELVNIFPLRPRRRVKNVRAVVVNLDTVLVMGVAVSPDV